MRASTAFSILALAGSTLAAPAPAVVENVHVVYETVVHTVYATEGYSAPTPPPAPIVEAPKTTVVYDAPKPTKEAATKPKPKPNQAYQPNPAPVPTQAYTPPAPAPTKPAAAPPSDDGYMSVVNEWRSKLGMDALKVNSVLEANAAEVVKRGNGAMVHHLFDNTEGQVLAPGEAGNDGFKKVFVGGWLCEIPGLPGLDGVCTEMSKGWAYEGQTGHAKILTDAKYKTIGCALAKGIWCCDVSSKDPTMDQKENY